MRGMDTLQERIKDAAWRAKSSQADIAAHLGVTRSTVNQWFIGRVKRIGAEHIGPVAAFLGVCEAWLNDGVGPRYPTTAYKAETPPEEKMAVAEPVRPYSTAALTPLQTEALRLGSSPDVLAKLTNAEVAQLLAVLTRAEERGDTPA